MEENSQSGNWWNTSRTSSFSTTAPTTASSSLSSSTKPIASVTSTPFMDSGLYLPGFSLSSSSPMDWNQSLFGSSSGRVVESVNFHSMFEETAKITEEQLEIITFRDINDPLLLKTGECSRDTGTFLLTSSSSSSSSLFDSQQMTNYQPHMNQKQSDINQLQFTSDSNFWNASDAAMNELTSGFCSSSDNYVLLKPFDLKPAGCSDHTVMSTEGAKEKKMRCEYAMNRPPLETPSPFPAFKVKKEKLGDRITALQQLVSPFGKTDTASVLHEAIEYIKFLHDQVKVLSTPYLRNKNNQHRSGKLKDGEKDLRSRGLCLVPMASAYPFCK